MTVVRLQNGKSRLSDFFVVGKTINDYDLL